MRNLRSRLPNVKPTITKTRTGGTGAPTAAQALTNLNAVPASLIDLPGGVLSLDSNKKLKPEVIAGLSVTGISINGPTSMTINQVQTFTITDYDSFLTYTITAISGSVSRSGDTITYTAPGSTGPAGFIINGKTISVAVGANIVLSPSINNVINGATNIDSTINLTGTAFTVSSGSDTHQFTDWQIATDSAFTSIVSQSLSDTVNKTSWTSGTLLAATTYYARVRYKGNAYGYSNWSSIISFTTKSSFLPTSELAILSASDKATTDLFGYSVSINTDATRVAVGVRYSDPGGSTYGAAGAVYVFLRSGASWTQEQKITANDKAASDEFGYSVYLDSTATRLIIGAPNADSAATDCGKAYIFTRSGTVWTQEAMLTASDKAVSDHFGFSVAIDDGGNRAIISSPSRGSAQGGVYVYLRTGTSWAQEAIIQADVPQVNSYFGNCISIDSSGTRVIIGSYNYIIGGNAQGKVFIYSRSGTVWTLEQGIIPSDEANLDKFGISVYMDNTGTRIIVGSSYADVSSIINCGKAYIFTRSGTVWTQEAILTANDKASSDYFGTSVSCNSDCSIVIIGAPNGTAGGLGLVGKAYIFTRSGTVWTQGASIYPASRSANDQFGYASSISKNGIRCAISAPWSDITGVTDCGKVVIFG